MHYLHACAGQIFQNYAVKKYFIPFNYKHLNTPSCTEYFLKHYKNNNKMTEQKTKISDEETKKLQAYILDIMVNIDRVCREHHLRYYL